MSSPSPSSFRLRVLASLLAVYIIWGSTYIAIQFAIQTMPPLLMAGTRFLVAGMLLFGWTRLRGTPRPTLANWRSGLIIGLLLLAGGNGLVVTAERVVPSSLVALLISSTPIWMVIIDWLRPGGIRPTLPVVFGLLLGFCGVALLIAPDFLAKGGNVNLWGALIVPLAALSWAAGSVYARTAKMPASPLMGTSLEMLTGGALLLLLGIATGEPAKLNLNTISFTSATALIYLIIFGSLVAFTAYVWLLRNIPLSQASTYAYVNPVVAVFLGWALASEKLTPITLIAAAITVLSVFVITTFRKPVPVEQPRIVEQPRPSESLPPPPSAIIDLMGSATHSNAP